jgi:hypothetical protein
LTTSKPQWINLSVASNVWTRVPVDPPYWIRQETGAAQIVCYLKGTTAFFFPDTNGENWSMSSHEPFTVRYSRDSV